MNTFTYAVGNDNAGFTIVENLFINEYLAQAKGDYIKVYLYGLKNSQNPGLKPLTTGELARILDLTESDILKAIAYWKEKDLIGIEENGTDRIISFYNIGSKLHYPDTAPLDTLLEFDEEKEKDFKVMIDIVQTMMGGEPITQAMLRVMEDWVDTYEFEPLVVPILVEYALNSMSKKTGRYQESARLNYMKKVAETWKRAGVKTYQQAEKQIQKTKENGKFVYDVLKEMRISGPASSNDYAVIGSWRNSLGLSDEMIMEAVRRAKVKEYKYIESILRRWQESGFKELSDLERDVYVATSKKEEDHPLSEERAQQYKENEQRDYDFLYGLYTPEDEE